MRIALVGRRFDPAGGGTERDLIVTARLLTAASHIVTIYAAESRGTETDLPVRRIRAPGISRTLRLLSFAARAGTVARRDDADLVLSFARIAQADILRSGGSAHSSFVAAAGRWQSPFARAAMRLSPYHRAQMRIERRGFESRALRLALAVSERVREDLIATFGLPAEKAVTLYNGVDAARFRPRACQQIRTATRRQWHVPEEAPLVAFVGNGFARKGLRFLLEAWPAVGAGACLLVAGIDQASTRYRRLSVTLGVADRVRFVGAQDQIERVFAASDACALPSLFEPFGNVVLEAMAAGLPVLCSRACGVAEVVPPGMREFVVDDPTNIDELATRLNLLLSGSREDLGRSARAAAERFTWKDYGVRLCRLLESVAQAGVAL
jgi:UDP-glucose:(heptosyl)LPS alpha-1,3-glucosyltransferase